MRGNRILLLVLILLLILLLGLGGLFVWLSGGLTGGREAGDAPVAEGLIPVRTIYVANGENLDRPVGIGADENGSFFVTLRDNQRIIEFDRQGDWVRSFGERGMEQGQILVPTGVAVDRLARHVYVTDRSRLRLLAYSLEGKFLWEIPILNPVAPVTLGDGLMLTTFGPLVVLNSQGELQKEIGTRGPDKGQFDYPRGAVAIDEDEVIVADSNNNRVQRVRLSGEGTASVVWVDGTPSREQEDLTVVYGMPSGVALDDRGRAFVLDGFKQEITVLDAKTGKRIHKFTDLQGKSEGRFNLPTGIVHLGGDTFAITDTYNDRVQIVRLLLPGEDGMITRFPWLLGLIPGAALLLLAFLLGKKRYFATDKAMERAQVEGRLRLVAAVARKVHVLPEVYERFAPVEEEDVRIGDYLEVVGDAQDDDASTGTSANATERLIAASRPSGLRRLLLPRVRTIVADEDEVEEFSKAPGKRMTIEDLARRFTIEGSPGRTEGASSGGADLPDR